ncbi:type 1 glutamine amidotransferase family protein, partial [Staphylococcus capitis]|uniref:pyridoxal 5'-phosphate synthase glutaminase subunit PdxT n=1 Tax=Staphylococcus capitis TaxID=29388 RepID=UPI0011A5702D
QGALRQHIPHIHLTPHQPLALKTLQQLQHIAPFIFPPGQSTTLTTLIHLYPFNQPLNQSDLPIFPTSPPLIILAKDVETQSAYLKNFDITLEPNSFPPQLHTFQSQLNIKPLPKHIQPLFIRPPHIP